MSFDWLTSAVSFASGVGVSLFGAVAASSIQKRREAKKRHEEAAFQVYMQLLELHGLYFWVASNELHGKQVERELASRIQRLAFRIADTMREADELKHLEQVLNVLMNEDAYRSANERARALDDLIGKIGNDVNPRYAAAIRRISEKNVLGTQSRPFDHQNNAPGLIGN